MVGERGTFLLAMAAVCLVAALDTVLGARAVLVELVLIGPVIAAIGASPKHTAIVAVFALVVSIPLGATSDAFGMADHWTGVITVALIGALAVTIARLRARRERDAARMEVQYRVARVLAEAGSLETSAPRLLAAIAEPLGWDVGHLFEVREPGTLRSVGSWTRAGLEVPAFEAATQDLVVRSKNLLPGHVWHTGKPTFIEDVLGQADFQRADAARQSGLRGGMAFPIASGGETVAVIELFSCAVQEPEPEMVDVTAAVGALIGEFIERLRAGEAVSRSEARKSALLASSLDAVIVMDHEGRVVEFNRAAEQIFERPAEEAVGAELAALVIPPALRERHRAALRRTVETGESALIGRRIELTGVRADGSEFPVELAITRIAGSDPPMFTGTVRDITRRRRQEQERDELLRLERLSRLDATEARDQLGAILSGIADAVTAQAPDGRLLFATTPRSSCSALSRARRCSSAPLIAIMDRFDVLDDLGEPFPLDRLPGRRALLAGVRDEVVVRFRVRATGEERWSAVKATPNLRPGRRSSDGHQRDRGHHDSQARRARAALPLREHGRPSAPRSDPEEVLGQVATLGVPEVADWLFVDLVTDAGVERVAVAHQDPDKVRRAEEALQGLAPGSQRPGRGAAGAADRTIGAPLRPDGRARGLDERLLSLQARARVRDALGGRRAHGRAGAHAGRAHARDRFDRAPVRRPRSRAGRGARSALRDRDRQRPPVLRPCVHRAHAPGQPPALRVAGHPGNRGRRPAFGPPARAMRWAATSMTCSRAAGAAGRW